MIPGFTKYARTLYYVSRNVLRGSGIYPFYASFKITSRCGSSCSHCYVPREEPVSDLDTEAAKTVIRNLASSSTFVLTLEGGEPFLRDDVGELLAFAYSFPVFVSVVTSYPDISMERHFRLSRYIDFLQISIDEYHGNMHLLDRLGGIAGAWRTRVCVQTVVSAKTVHAMEAKARAAYTQGCKILFIPLSLLYPDMAELRPERGAFVQAVRMLKKKYPKTVMSSSRFLDSFDKRGGCSSSTIIIDSDGGLFYPCHILKTKPFSLLDGRLHDFVLSEEAERLRARMRGCSKTCGWYQYSAVSFASARHVPGDILSSLERIR